MKRFLFLTSLLVTSALPASALTEGEIRQCNALAATFGPKKAEFDALTAARDELAAAAETAGEDWENAEALRDFGADKAAAADAKKATYDEALIAFEATQRTWQTAGQQLNADFATFNATCTADD
ncbi:MAG: hypothetical protein AAF950_07400 [Pseudomonadota bacterium]